MNVIHVLNNLSDGGAEAFIMDLIVEARSIQRANQMLVVSLVPTEAATHQRRSEELEAIDSCSYEAHGPVWRQAYRLSKIASVRNPDIVHAHNLRAAVVASLAKVGFGMNFGIVFTQHIDRLKRGRFHALVMRRWIDAYIAICEPAMVDMRKRLGSSGKLNKVPNGIPAFDSSALVFRKERRVNIAMVARFNSQKAHEVVMQAIALLKERNLLCQYHFWFLGDGPLKPEIEALSRTLDVSEAVTFSGNVANARRSFSGFDAILICSYSEGMPIVALEARRAGVPILSNSVGAMPELIEEGVNGCLMPFVPQADALASGLVKFLDRRFLDKLKAGARSSSGEYGIRECLDKHLIVYNQVLRARQDNENPAVS